MENENLEQRVKRLEATVDAILGRLSQTNDEDEQMADAFSQDAARIRSTPAEASS
jgi:hypothetical protein